MNKAKIESIDVFELFRGVQTDNGATPWYTILKMGSQKQPLRFAIDTGTTHSWITSVLCTTGACLNHQRFDFRGSTSYKQVSSQYNPQNISFGPWGTMTVSLGQDTLSFIKPGENKETQVDQYNIYISQEYDGKQFRDLIWDGGIGVPVHRPVGIDSSELITILFQETPLKNHSLFFNYRQSKLQFMDLGDAKGWPGLVKCKLKENELLPNTWIVNLGKIKVNNDTLFSNIDFCIDTGSSRFKGDPDIINEIKKHLTYNGLLPEYVAKENPNFSAYPDFVLEINEEKIVVSPEQYFEKLAENYYVMGFHPMEGLDKILLAGSTFLEHYNPVFFFDKHLKGKEVGLFIVSG